MADVSGTGTTSGVLEAGTPAALVDDNTATPVTFRKTNWVKWDFGAGTPPTVDRWRIFKHSSSGGNLGALMLQGSTTGTFTGEQAWLFSDTTEDAGMPVGEWVEHQLAPPISYRYLRMYYGGMGGFEDEPAPVILAEIELLEPPLETEGCDGDIWVDNTCALTLGRAISDTLQALIEAPVSHPAFLWKVAVEGRAIEGYTSLDEDLDYNDGSGLITYQSAGNASPTEVPVSIGLSTDATEVKTLLHLAGTTIGKVLAGWYDSTLVTLYMVDFTDLSAGHVILTAGRLGSYTMTDLAVTFEFLNWGALAAKDYGRVTLFDCPWAQEFGTGRCYNDPALGGLGDGPNVNDPGENRIRAGALTAALSKCRLQVTGITAAEDWASRGRLYFTAGEYMGIPFSIKKWEANGANLYLHNDLPFLPDGDEAVTVQEGCIGNWAACIAHTNTANYGGQNALPGAEIMGKVKDEE